MTANIRKTWQGRWYFVSSRTGISTSNWSSRAKAVDAARAAGHLIILGE